MQDYPSAILNDSSYNVTTTLFLAEFSVGDYIKGHWVTVNVSHQDHEEDQDINGLAIFEDRKFSLFWNGIEGALLKISIESTLPCVVLVDLYQFSLQQVRVVSV